MNRKNCMIGLVLASALLLGCDQENRKLIYDSDTNAYVSFRTDKLDKELEKTENSMAIPLYRENTTGEADVHVGLLFLHNPDGSEIPGKEYITLEDKIITFDDGENTAYVNLDIDLTKLDYLTKAKTLVKLVSGKSTDLSAFGKSTLTVSLSRKPTWLQMDETGKYTSSFLESEKEVIVIKAEEAPFYIIKDCYVTNGDLRVDLDKDGNATIEQQKAFRHAEYGIVYAAGTGMLDATGNRIIMQLNFLVEQEGEWGILGGTSFEEILSLPSK